MIKADALYIGYPRSGSTYLRAYFRDHPQINYDDQQIAEILYQRPDYQHGLIDKPPGKVYISCDESICESVCVTGDTAVWGKNLYKPGCFNLVRHDIIIDPREAARRMKKWHPRAKVLIVIRDQVSWFESLYRATISSLPPNQRTFNDYWLTPQGIAMRSAGYHDRVLDAWMRLYDDVMVVRYEKLMALETSQNLCRWLGVSHVPFPNFRVNESHSGLAALHQKLPFLSAMPFGVKAALKPLVKYLPGKHSQTIDDEYRNYIAYIYKESNQRTEAMLQDRRVLCLS